MRALNATGRSLDVTDWIRIAAADRVVLGAHASASILPAVVHTLRAVSHAIAADWIWPSR
jgi:hypothetical protein